MQQQLGIAARSLQSTVPWTTIKMSTCSIDQQQQLGMAAKSSQSTVPRTTIRTSTRSINQQQLREAAAHLPALDAYGYGHSVQLLHPQVMSLRGEYRPNDNATSSSRTDDNASSSPPPPEVQPGSCRKSAKPLTGALHQNNITPTNPYKSTPDFRPSVMYSYSLQLWTFRCHTAALLELHNIGYHLSKRSF